MSIFDILKKQKFEIKNIEFIDETDLIIVPETNLIYNDVEITISSNKEESLKHIKEDYVTLVNEGIENLIKTNFISWLKGEDFKDLDDDKIYDGLRITNISYQYHRIIDKYSPTECTDYFGEFEFDFESSNDYTKNLLEASAFVVLINNGKVYQGRNFDI